MNRESELRSRLEPLLDATTRALPEVLSEAAGVACDVLGCGRAAVQIAGTDGRPELYPEDAAAEWLEKSDAARAAVATVLEQAAVVRAPDAEASDEAPALLAVPVLLRGRCAGAVLLGEPTGRPGFTDEDERAALSAATAVATIVEKARTAAENRRRDRWLSGAADLTRELVTYDQPNPLRLITERVLGIADADVVTIVRPAVISETLVLAAVAGERAAAWEGSPLPPTVNALIGGVLAGGKPAAVPHLADTDLLPAEIIEELGLDAVIVVPLTGPGGSRGALTIGRGPGRRGFSAAEVGVATMFAGQVALALELADSQARRDQLALIDERDRIARDLHDHVIQRLFAIGLALQNASADLPGQVGERLRAGVDDLDETIKQIRATIYRLTGPIVASRTSLRSRAAQLIEDVEPVLGFRPSLKLEGAIDFGISEDVAHDCIAVLREALSNVARHAHATATDVTIAADAEAITLEVSDDGRGMGETKRRSGLANLRARAELRAGSLTVDGRAGGGTRLVWTIPMQVDESDPG